MESRAQKLKAILLFMSERLPFWNWINKSGSPLRTKSKRCITWNLRTINSQSVFFNLFQVARLVVLNFVIYFVFEFRGEYFEKVGHRIRGTKDWLSCTIGHEGIWYACVRFFMYNVSSGILHLENDERLCEWPMSLPFKKLLSICSSACKLLVVS